MTTIATKKFKILNRKKSWMVITIFIALFITAVFLAGWYKGVAFGQALNQYVNAHNTEFKNVVMSTELKDDSLFSKQYQVTLNLINTASAKNEIVKMQIFADHGFMQTLFKSGDVAIEAQFELLDLAGLMRTYIFDNKSEHIILPNLDLTKPVTGQIKIVFDSTDGIEGTFKTINLSKIFPQDTIQMEELTGKLKVDHKTQLTKVDIYQPMINFISSKEISTDNSEIETVAQLIDPVSHSAKIKETQLSFTINSEAQITNSLLTAEDFAIDGFVAKKIKLDLDLVEQKDNRLGSMNGKIDSESLTLNQYEFGQVKGDIAFGNIDFNALTTLIDNAHARYKKDKNQGVNKFNLGIYYFTQWLKYKEQILLAKPYVNIKMLDITNGNARYKQSFKWQFKPGSTINEPIANELITSLFAHTEAIAFDMELNHDGLRKLVAYMLGDALSEEQLNEHMYSINELNNTIPFLEIEQETIAKIAEVRENSAPKTILNKGNRFSTSFDYDAGKAEVMWLNKPISMDEFRNVLNRLGK